MIWLKFVALWFLISIPAALLIGRFLSLGSDE